MRKTEMRYEARMASKRARQRRQRWLPLALIAVGVVVLAGTVWVFLGSRASGGRVPVEVTGAPRLRANQQRVDLGDVRLGQPVEVRFELANVGDRLLTFAQPPYVSVAEGC